MKTPKFKTLSLKEEPPAYAAKQEAASMVRTQIYLTPQEHRFVDSESRRKGITMAAVIRGYIDEKMQLPAGAWKNNPLLVKPDPDPDWEGPEDGSINHDHYVYGAPKRYIKKRGKWVETPEILDED